ncbi:MAG: glycosyltransferase family 39 protein, partial [Ktedonobacteraceae bacterium]|nr:glycosyltransferase family 39 protein [Ktedonobacteraceae bacterium]
MHTDTQATEILPAAKRLKRNMVRRAPAWLIAGFLLLCACAGASWFAYQVFLVPQTTSFEPDWHDAQWIRAADGRTPVTSFRYVVNQLAVPDAAFITIAANQQFRAYVNGTFIGTNTAETIQGKVPQAYIYDVLSELVPGPNVIAIRVSNLDSQVPTLRASLGIVHGANVEHFGTGSKWQATTQGLKTNHRYETAVPPWTSYGFDASDWQPCKAAPAPSFTPLLTINQKLYERPLPLRWMSAGAGHDAYFVRHFNLPGGTTRTWMRLIATGPANIFINGRLLIVWNGQVPIVQQQPVDYLDDTNVLLPDQDAVNEYRGGLGLGIYDISPYLKAGTNTVAVHVTAPGSSNALVGLGTLNAALTLDMLVSDTNHQSFWVASDSANTDWRAARQDRPDWIYGDQATMQAWKAPFAIGRPGTSKMVYLPDSVSTSNTNVVPLSWIAQTIFLSCAAVLGLWLLMGRLIVWWSGAKTLEAKRKVLLASTLAFLPALAGEVLLVVLDHENLIAQPFPYSWPWALLLLALVAAGYALLGLVARHWPLAWQNLIPARLRRGSRRASSNGGRVLRGKRARILGWLRLNWGLVLIMLVALPMISYQLTYEPYWQDELTSYYAAKGILAHGLPFMPSGFLYPKGELYSYILALCIAIFGEQHGLMRLPSVVAYLVSLPVFYYIAGKFFDRRVALL